MADNTTLNPAGPGGDTVRTVDRTGTGAPKTEVVQLDAGGPSPNKESLVSPSNPLPVWAPFDPTQLDDDGIPFVNPQAPSADLATGILQIQQIAAINGTAMSPGTPLSIAVGTSSVAVLGANPVRRGLLLMNTSTAGQSISFHLNGGTAVSLAGLTLYQGDVWEMDRYSLVTGAINAIASAASATLGVQELN